VALSYPNVIVVDEMKKGLAAARQAGFLASTGDLIANVDSDSILTPGWTDTVMERFSSNPKLIALSGPFLYHDLSLASNIGVRFWYVMDYCLYFINRFILRVSSHLQGGNFIVKRSVLEQIGGFDQAFPFWGEDTHLAKQLNPLGPVVFTFKLPMYSSGRRLKKEGLITMSCVYALNFFWPIIFDKPYTRDSYQEIRNEDFDKVAFRTSVLAFNRALLYGKMAFVVVVFSFIGGTTYLYNKTISTLVPETALASTVDLKDHPIISRVHNSIVSIKSKIKVLETDFRTSND
jgi:glycosyltransferase involved in cell wall biosynthesis